MSDLVLCWRSVCFVVCYCVFVYGLGVCGFG